MLQFLHFMLILMLCQFFFSFFCNQAAILVAEFLTHSHKIAVADEDEDDADDDHEVSYLTLFFFIFYETVFFCPCKI